MEKLRRRFIILITIMLLTSVVVNWLNYDTFYKADAALQTIENIPLELGKWQGTDVPLEERVFEILETKSIINRRYHAENGKEVFLSIVYYPETKVDFHMPEACLGGQGIEIKKFRKSINITNDGHVFTIELNELLLRNGEKDSLVYYFYKAGEFVGSGYTSLRLNLAMNKFKNLNKSASLIRISTPILFRNIQEASDNLEDFISRLYPLLIKYL